MAFLYDGDKAGEVNATLSGVSGIFIKWLGENLKGLYLHGSLAMGCFRPWSSDIDLLAVVLDPMDREDKLGLVGDIMAVAEGGAEFRSIEFSIVTADEAAQARHPIRYISHYSVSWHQAYKEGRAELVVEGGQDEDLAAHFMVIRRRGVALYGAPINEAIGQVSVEDYLRAVWYDISGAEGEVLKKPMYVVLNLCRTLMYLRTGSVGSKLEGGRWTAIQPELARWKPMIEEAIMQYTAGHEGKFDDTELSNFALWMLKEIKPHII